MKPPKTPVGLPRSEPLLYIETAIRDAEAKAEIDTHDIESVASAALDAAQRATLIQRRHPHQLRHSVGTRMRQEIGLENTRIAMGHWSTTVTEWYAEIDLSRGWEAMAKLG